ncbi:MAG: thioesterase family protein [Ilumatobacteraceae bacterium]
MADSFFTMDADDDWFSPTDHCRGPWDPESCHAGPPSGLMARASERLVPEQRLVRLTVNLTRPIPVEGFRVESVIVRAGRTVTTTALTLVDRKGKAIVNARALHVREQPPVDLPTSTWDPPSLARSPVGDFPISESRHPLPNFTGDGVEVRYPPGNGPGGGPNTMWMRTVPLLDDEEPSGFQRICPLADCGNAVSRNAEPWEYTFVNPDLTIVLHREPLGEWLGAAAVSRWEPSGIGMSDALLFDEHGAVGRALQTLVITPHTPHTR